MFKRILCPIDLTTLSTVALDVASKLGVQNDATISLVHVALSPLPRSVEPARDWERNANARLGRLAQRHFGDRVRWDTVIFHGDPAKVIMRAADDLDADLIVMATHGHKGFNRLLLASGTEQVVRESSLPVRTIRPGRPQR